MRNYDESQIQLNVVRWAMVDVLKHPPPGFEEVVQKHFRIMKHRYSLHHHAYSVLLSCFCPCPLLWQQCWYEIIFIFYKLCQRYDVCTKDWFIFSHIFYSIIKKCEAYMKEAVDAGVGATDRERLTAAVVELHGLLSNLWSVQLKYTNNHDWIVVQM